MILGLRRNVFLPGDRVQVQDYKENNVSLWNMKDLCESHPEIVIQLVTYNRKGLIFVVSEEEAKRLA